MFNSIQYIHPIQMYVCKNLNLHIEMPTNINEVTFRQYSDT